MNHAEQLESAQAKLGQGEWEAGLQLAEALVRADPPPAPDRLAKALKLVGIARWQLGDEAKAVAALEKAIEADPTNASCHHNLACMYSLQGEKAKMLACLEEEIRCGFKHYASDRRESIARDPDFEAWRQDPEFLRVCDRLPADPLLRKVYALLGEEKHFAAWQAAREVEGRVPDELGLLHAMEYALAAIVDDLEEHGEANLEEYGGGARTREDFLAERNAVTARVDALQRGGAESEVFLRFKGRSRRRPR